MILVELNGGIGNQMFQYAAAKSLALHKKTILKLDVTPASHKSMPQELKARPFDLHYFDLPDPIAASLEIASFLTTKQLGKIIEKTKANHKRKIYREPFFHYDENFFKANGDVFLKGLWQSEKYFKPFEKEIRNIFTFKEVSHLASQNLKNETSVSVHIRRGDYLTKISQEILGTLPISYYQQAIEVIKSKISNSTFYFFSDDIDWAKSNFQIPNAIFVSNSLTKNHFEDLYLMTQCQHNIIANSSFSWWGAWLNDNPNKIVIAPERWFNKGPKDTQDLIPEGWIKI